MAGGRDGARPRREVPVICLAHLTDGQRRAYRIAETKIIELGEWDLEILAGEFSAIIDLGVDPRTTAFETSEIDLTIRDLEQQQPDDADDVPPLDEAAPPASRLGDIWCLGRHHRVICGSALDQTTYHALLGGREAQMVLADAPYNVRIDGNVCGSGRIRHAEFVMASGELSDEEFIEFLATSMDHCARVSANGSIHFWFMDWRHLLHAQLAGQRSYTEHKNTCVWVKSNGGMGSLYRSRHEFILVYKYGKAPHFNNVELGRHGRYRTNVWEYTGISSFSDNRDEELAMHPTVKPLALVADAILDCSHRGGVILDPFLGSGTTIIAAEQTGRHGYGIELDPRYVDVAICRWEKFSGIAAVHADTGLTFAEMAGRRAREAEGPLLLPPPAREAGHG